MIEFVNESDLEKWDVRFLNMACLVGSWSKEPRKKVGAVIVGSKNRIVSMGYNGFPRGVEDLPERMSNRELKNAIAVHAEVNAILAARQSLNGSSLYITPMFPCSHCAGAIVQSGIKRVVANVGNDISEDWLKSAEVAKMIFHEAKINVIFVKTEKV